MLISFALLSHSRQDSFCLLPVNNSHPWLNPVYGSDNLPLRYKRNKYNFNRRAVITLKTKTVFVLFIMHIFFLCHFYYLKYIAHINVFFLNITLFLNFYFSSIFMLYNSAFKQGNLDLRHYINAFIIIIN